MNDDKNDKPLESNNALSKAGGRIARYSKVSGTMAALAAKLAGERYLGFKIEREEHALQLMQALGNLKGPLMKVGQILATIPEALPPEYARAMQELQSNAPPMGWNFVRRRMKTELSAGWQDLFQNFERDSAAAASLGQVHKATSLDGDHLACKLQYPDMQSAIESDLKQLKMIFGIYERYDKAVQTSHIHAELAERLQEELDYRREAKHCKMYEHILRDEPCVHVPHVHDDLSTDRLLTTNWLDGKKITNYFDADIETRNTLAKNIFRAWYVPLYHYGIIHGDPHLGNYTVRDDLSINLLDFGCVRVFRPKFVGGVIDLYNALKTNDNELAVHAYETWGFNDLTKEHVETLNIWAEFLYGPILEDKTRRMGHAEGSSFGRNTAEKVHKKLRELGKARGGLTVPREFVFMDRAALGLGSVFIHLNAEVNWHQLFNEMIEEFDAETMQTRQNATLKMFDL